MRTTTRTMMRKSVFTLLGFASLMSLGLGLAGCSRDSQKTNFEYVPHMIDQPFVKAQRPGPWGEGMRLAPEDTLARNAPDPYRYPNDPEKAGKELKNPLPHDEATILRGQKYYNTYCIVCHGPKGEGNGFVVPKFPMPPSLHSEKVRTWPDGRIYHVISMGQNLMPSYASQINREDRWAIIHYVRELQKELKAAGR